MTPSAFIFLYENQLFLTFRQRRCLCVRALCIVCVCVCVWVYMCNFASICNKCTRVICSVGQQQ
jgi:hypothetical protein